MIRTAVASLIVLGSMAAALAATPGRDDFAGGLAALTERDFAAAEARFRAVLAVSADSYEAHNNLAVALALQGRDEDAVPELRTALTLRPDYDRARQNLAAIYVRLAAKEMLASAEVADGPRRLALAARAREILVAGPNLPSPELLARADQLAGSIVSPSVASTLAAPAAATAKPSLTASPTATPRAEVTPPTDTGRDVPSETSILVEPEGIQLLLLDPKSARATLYRRTATALVAVGSWPLKWRGAIPQPGLRGVARRSEWSVRMTDPVSQRAMSWAIESVTKTTKSSDAAVFDAKDFRAATATLVPGRDVVALAGSASEALTASATQTIRERLEGWRRAWTARDVVAYAAFYAADFSDERGRSRADWQTRKQAIFEHSGEIAVELRDVTLAAAGDEAVTTFEQAYQSAIERSRGRKILVWKRRDGQWQIVSEQAVDAPRRAGRDEPAR